MDPKLHWKTKRAGLAGARYGASLKRNASQEEDDFCLRMYPGCSGTPRSYRFPGTRLDKRAKDLDFAKLATVGSHLNLPQQLLKFITAPFSKTKS